MYSWQTSNIRIERDSSFLKEGAFIWVINYPKIPPHLAISIDGMYYSVTTEVAQLHKPIDSLIRLFESKKKPVFFVKFAFDALNNKGLEEVFTMTLENGATCIEPINKLLFNDDRFACQTIGELLNQLERLNQLESVHVQDYLTPQHVGVLTYSKSDVINYIETKKKGHVFAI